MYVVQDGAGVEVARTEYLREAYKKADESGGGHRVFHQVEGFPEELVPVSRSMLNIKAAGKGEPFGADREGPLPAIRTATTGASRDGDVGKLSYARGLSSQVLQRYLEYLGQHRTMKDGSLRDWDNWKRGMPVEWFAESLDRHVHDAIRASQGLPVPENATLEDLLCAVIFNASGWLFELLVAKSGNREAAC